MSIAWATVVLVVLLLPGFAFFWGFYSPNYVSRESVPASPLTQLAGVIIVAFVSHALAYGLVNASVECKSPRPGDFIQCVDPDRFMAVLRTEAEAKPGQPIPKLRDVLDGSIGQIVVYFFSTGAIAFAAGLLFGKLVERGILPFSRHRYLFMLERSRSDEVSSKKTIDKSSLISAHVLSRTSHDGLIVIYEGVVRDFFSKADGTISYIVLRDPECGTLKIGADVTARSGERKILNESKLPGSFFLITSDDIANIFFEPLSTVTNIATDDQRLDEELKKLGDDEDTLEDAVQDDSAR